MEAKQQNFRKTAETGIECIDYGMCPYDGDIQKCIDYLIELNRLWTLVAKNPAPRK